MRDDRYEGNQIGNVLTDLDGGIIRLSELYTGQNQAFLACGRLITVKERVYQTPGEKEA